MSSLKSPSLQPKSPDVDCILSAVCLDLPLVLTKVVDGVTLDVESVLKSVSYTHLTLPTIE